MYLFSNSKLAPVGRMGCKVTKNNQFDWMVVSSYPNARFGYKMTWLVLWFSFNLSSFTTAPLSSNINLNIPFLDAYTVLCKLSKAPRCIWAEKVDLSQQQSGFENRMTSCRRKDFEWPNKPVRFVTRHNKSHTQSTSERLTVCEFELSNNFKNRPVTFLAYVCLLFERTWLFFKWSIELSTYFYNYFQELIDSSIYIKSV